MTRLLLLLSLVLVLISAWFIYSQGILTQLLNPTVMALQAQDDIQVSQRVRVNMITPIEVPVSDVPPGVLTFRRDASEDILATFLGQGRTLAPVAQGVFLDGTNFGRAPDIWHIRTLAPFQLGDPIDSSDLEVYQSEVPEPGAFTFPSRQEAQVFVDGRDALRAARPLEPSSPIGLDDVSSGEAGVIYALETVRQIPAGEALTPADVRAITVPSTEIPRGAIAFPSRSGADIFVTASQSLVMAYDVPPGTALLADMVRPGAVRSLRNDLDLETSRPETLAELVELQSQFPFEIKTINLVNGIAEIDVTGSVPLIGAPPVKGEKMDMWVETQRTTGPFATVTLRRFVKGITIEQVVDPELVLSTRAKIEEAQTQEVSGATPPRDLEQELLPDARGIFYWANVTRPGGLAIEEAKEEERIVFMLSNRTPVSDFLGNGVLCREDVCTVSMSITDNLAVVRTALADIASLEEQAEAEQVPPAPFSIMDGVSPELEAEMHSQGYLTFEDVALWEDASLQLVEFQLGISRTLALYIRQQARTIFNTPTLARQELGMASAPNQ